MKKNQRTGTFNHAATGKTNTVKTPPQSKVIPAKPPTPALNSNPPGTKKSIQNQMAMDKAASQRLNQSQKTMKSTKSPQTTKQQFNSAAQPNMTDKFNVAAQNKNQSRSR